MVIVPSTAETFGLVAAEAMAAGTPVVCFDVGNLPELVGDAGAAVPSSHKHARLWRAAAELLDDQVRYLSASRAGYYQTRDYRPVHIAHQLFKVVS